MTTKLWQYNQLKDFIGSFRCPGKSKNCTRQTFADGAWKFVLNESISMARAKKIITKISVQTFLWSSSCGHAFNTSSTAVGSLKVTNPNPLQDGYKNRKKTTNIMLHIAYSSDMPFTIQSWSRLLSELEGRKGVSSASSAFTSTV